ncbi:hypothetical protein [Paraburkholderia sp. SIMBA_054]|uniref:hypothetical protein n=1 Tax=Paraburkholderia sp. SIMBA_054 TaxID=3085795 RepID=UPI00397BA354
MNTATVKIDAKRLADIVSMLLINPQRVGELDTQHQHADFMRAIGEVVANHCGGEVNTDADAPALLVAENDSLPDDGGIWTFEKRLANTTTGQHQDDGILVEVIAHDGVRLEVTARVTRDGVVKTVAYTQRDIVAVDHRYTWNLDVSGVDAVLCALAAIYRRAVDTSSWTQMVGMSFTVA